MAPGLGTPARDGAECLAFLQCAERCWGKRTLTFAQASCFTFQEHSCPDPPSALLRFLIHVNFLLLDKVRVPEMTLCVKGSAETWAPSSTRVVCLQTSVLLRGRGHGAPWRCQPAHCCQGRGHPTGLVPRLLPRSCRSSPRNPDEEPLASEVELSSLLGFTEAAGGDKNRLWSRSPAFPSSFLLPARVRPALSGRGDPSCQGLAVVCVSK